ncbi:ABC transporter ATP-binding protein [uncultured Sphaerochaeta sp.]|uniref:ABC transporter ATP-binding protein n=1 Tax=uncultured Sphaerochaeta sp. TaxID=886478 RepID=UPI0029CA4356|nr:ABC transporter ATP-binding protein [uncultured Sphaerochaeta sp.]
MGNEIVLNVSHLSKQYRKGVKAVDDISFSLKEGEIFGLLGPNGSGKTTTILMLLGLLESTEGTVEVLGHDPFRKPLAVKKQVGYMPDTIGFYEYMTAYENLDYTARFLGLNAEEREKRIKESIGKMRLTDRMHDKVKTYSHGMKRRLGLAELLVKEPRIAILDEPTQGLDPQSIREFLSLIASLRDSEGMTFLLSSHQLDEVQSVCDRVGLFSEGKLISFGSVDSLGEEHFGKEVLIDLQAEGKENLELLLKKQKGVIEVSKTGEHHYLVTASEDIRQNLAQQVFSAGCNLTSLEMKKHSLNEIYQLAYKEASNE